MLRQKPWMLESLLYGHQHPGAFESDATDVLFADFLLLL
jgi:hypothetical protein